MSGQIFSKQVILHLKPGSTINDAIRVFGSEYGTIFAGIGYSMNGDGYNHPVVTGVACDMVSAGGFSKYDCVGEVEITDLEG